MTPSPVLSPLRSLGALGAVALVCLSMGGCRGKGEASVLLEFVDPAAMQGLTGVRAALTVADEQGRHPSIAVVDAADGVFVEAVDVPLPCNATGCSAAIQLDPGTYDAVLVLSAEDRCGQASPVMTFEGPIDVAHWETTTAALTFQNAAFDADDDGVLDVLEASLCGRFDGDDGLLAPTQCAPGHEACCASSSQAIGRFARIAAATDHALPYRRDPATPEGSVDVVDVDAFSMASTEMTFGQLARCVAAGVCLAGRPEHPARQALADGVDADLPARGLTPADAAALCGHFGLRLPTDAEWDLAARGPGADRRYPFVDGTPTAVGCLPTDPAPAARYRAANRDCNGTEPLPVGSYVTSAILGDDGEPVFDLAGNVAEWTVIGTPADAAAVVDDDDDGLPDGVAGVVLRGGSAASFVELLENDLALIFDANDDVDVARVQTAVTLAGVRCVVGETPVVAEEPVCPAAEAGRFLAE